MISIDSSKQPRPQCRGCFYAREKYTTVASRSRRLSIVSVLKMVRQIPEEAGHGRIVPRQAEWALMKLTQ